MQPRPSRRLATAAAVAALSAGLIAGCGGGSGAANTDTPRGELTAAIDALGQTDVLTSTLATAATAGDLQAYAQAQGDRLSAADAATLAATKVVLETKSTDGKDLADSSSGNAADVALQVQAAAATLFELRVTGGDVYLRADAKGILARAHRPKTYADLQTRARTQPAFVGAALRGDWVSLNGAAAQGLAGNFGGTTSGGDTGVARQLIDGLKQAIAHDATVTSVGSDQRGDHLVVAAHTRAIAADLLQAVTGAVPGGSLLATRADPSKLTDGVIHLDAWVKDGVLTEISVDTAQLHPSAGQASLPITATFDRSGADITAPANATPVDLTRLGAVAQAFQ